MVQYVKLFPSSVWFRFFYPIAMSLREYSSARDFRNQSETHVTEDLFWGSPGKTEEQTAVFQKISSFRSCPNSGSPHPHVPIHAGSWTASLYAPRSSTPAGTQTTHICSRGDSGTHCWFTGKQELHHLIQTPTADVILKGFIYRLFLASPATGSSNNPNTSLWMCTDQIYLQQFENFRNVRCKLANQKHLQCNTEWIQTQQLTHQGNILHFVSRQEEEKPVHLTECCLIPFIDWPGRKHKSNSLYFFH